MLGLPYDDIFEKWAREDVGIKSVSGGTTEEELKAMINKEWRKTHEGWLVQFKIL